MHPAWEPREAQTPILTAVPGSKGQLWSCDGTTEIHAKQKAHLLVVGKCNAFVHVKENTSSDVVEVFHMFSDCLRTCAPVKSMQIVKNGDLQTSGQSTCSNGRLATESSIKNLKLISFLPRVCTNEVSRSKLGMALHHLMRPQLICL